MRAIVYSDKNETTLAMLDDPIPGTHEVVVDVRASGICHTDIEVLKGNYGENAFPLVPGHEYAGEVSAVGTAVKGFSIGDRVVVDPNFECGICGACKKGWAHLCENLGAYGVTKHGGFAEKSVVDYSALHKIGDMPFEIAALAEPMGCVLNGLDASRAAEADNALIFGGGPIGLLLAIGMQVRGVKEISIVDINESRLEIAESFGFNPVAAACAEVDSFKHDTDLVVDATGVPSVAGQLPNYISNGGVGLYFGVCPADARIEISPFEVFRRQLSLVGSHSLNHNIPEAIRVITEFGNDIGKITTHKLPFEEINEALTGNFPAGSMKIQWQSGL
jgi:2-desacetyl-2-hydroxyethyl bacteriochlorophyllide A dehydrogenase